MNAFTAFYKSSIGKKVVMSLTGLFLCTFLVEHLIGNFLLFMNDGGASYDAYTEFMSHNFVVRTIEIVLFASIIGHAFSGVVVWIQNKRARPERYEMHRLKENTTFSSRITMVTGTVVFVFLVVHLRTFFVPTRFSVVKLSPYHLVEQAFSSGAYTAFYILAMILLGYHLRHGFQSAFQTLGLRSKRLSVFLDVIAIVFWLVIPLLFATMPIYFFYFHKAGPATMVLGAH